MGALYLLLPISLILVVLIGVAFWWAIFAGQFDDTDAAARSILDDDDSTASPPDDSHRCRK
ncbi:cbb3-type cytochrome oxidase assembly protein CcoS [Neopusillimonas aromaticivorans]|jgi:cbb3-type cytochrome oxidase maturation protein|uniref:cbb3-type cytochrome oxidase assembly protein CcoS n=1 Tax=Neopusillimonas aromaticivorans TaxID=2979868 RepID=UPI00259A1F5C|nr:cbb3-type cytochrome oxidase assembly protein CcoS [Neopusillimonas aromaticivorans]NLZ10919.1 cbb3-type cytochrome oxidase assembly protein CcoS [Alcaligenaceae bacterium]WJJ93382.1 cbb3-type cytochrome oxidase assembly protein CcoS [Neopusillimonas aromaticivorans]